MSTVIDLSRPVTELFQTVPEFVTMAQLMAVLGIQSPDRRVELHVHSWMQRQGWCKTVRRINNRPTQGYVESSSHGELGALTDLPAEPIELRGIAETLREGQGFWRTCSGCHESNEGHPTGPYSEAMECTLGMGCSECGGIGAVWDTTDYNAMADAQWESMRAPESLATTSTAAQTVTAAAREAVGVLTFAARDVLLERERQITKEGWRPDHDDEHRDGSLSAAAACYLLTIPHAARLPDGWPWDAEWWKPKDRRSNLVRAAALTLAEIERFDRAAQPESGVKP